MKKAIFLTATLLFALGGRSQSNNPQNKVGADIVAAGQVVARDFKAGKLKDINQATLDNYYKTLLPGYETVKLADFSRIVNAMKGASSESAIANSGLTDTAKQFLKKSLTDYSQTALVEDVKKSKLPESEKTAVLTVLAINYNMIPKTGGAAKAGANRPKGPYASFDIDFNDAEFSSSPQVAIWSAIGAIVGFYTCGPWCAVIGGVIGIVIGSSTGNTTISGPGGSHTYTSGGPQP